MEEVNADTGFDVIGHINGLIYLARSGDPEAEGLAVLITAESGAEYEIFLMDIDLLSEEEIKFVDGETSVQIPMSEIAQIKIVDLNAGEEIDV